jgi:putative redox protein
MTTSPPRRIKRVEVTFTMPAGLSAQDRQKLERAADTCPVYKSVHPEMEIPIQFVYPD